MQTAKKLPPQTSLFLALAFAAPQAFASITVQPFGVTAAGQAVEQVTLVNERGMALSYIDYGATITAIRVPDRKGRAANVMLGLPTLAAYESTKRRHGAVIGRYAGRIGKATFTLDGRTVKLPANARGLAIHGDPAGYDRRVWRRHDFADRASIGSVFQLSSPDGDQGFPGRVALRVTYRLLRKQNELRIEYSASSDAPTVINLTNHGFFNLSGAGTRTLASHAFRIKASRYVVTDALRVPTGELADVAGTPLDFRRGAGVTARLAQAAPMLGEPAWFDHGLVFDKRAGELAPVATIDDAASGRRMRVSTTEPSVLFNSGNGYDGSETGSEGVAYQRHDGFAFETQHLADSPNHAHFPSTALRPDKPYRSVTAFRFSVF
ncbi:MAG: aldose epimerase family protein [Pseudomonadota bacterium]